MAETAFELICEAIAESKILNYYYTDENGETYPLGIKLDDCSIFEDYGIYEKHETILGIIDNSERIDNTVEFIRYIFHQSGIQ